MHFSEKEIKHHWKDLQISQTDFKAAIKPANVTDIEQFVTKQDVSSIY